MQVGERKLLAPQMHSITITLRVHCWSLISTGEEGKRGLGGIEMDGDIREGKKRLSEECLKVDERKYCIKEIQKNTHAEKGEEGK